MISRRKLAGAVVFLLLVCGGLSFVPASWLARLTIGAGEGAQSPDAAANIYLTALSYNIDEGLTNVLAADRQESLLAQWRRYRLAIDQTHPKPERLAWGALTVVSLSVGQAHVSTNVTAAWARDESLPRTWQFETHEYDNGWQVTLVLAPRWCGDYAVPPACRESQS